MTLENQRIELHVARYLDRPGKAPAKRAVRIDISPQEIQLSTGHGGRLLAMSPPVNAHDHGYGIRTIGFGGVDDALETWIAGLQLRPRVDPYLKALVAFGRLAEGGVGATMHCHNAATADRLWDEATAVIRAAQTVGIHLAFSCPLADLNPWVYGGPAALRPFMTDAEWAALAPTIPSYRSPEDQIAVVEALADAYQGNGVDIQYGPIGPPWCSEELLRSVSEASARTGRRVHMHLLESPRQRIWHDRQYPEGIIRYLDRIGLLSPRLAVAHGVQLRPDECELLAERGVTVVSNPAANLRLRSGIAPVPAFVEAGLAFAIGLDGTGMDDDQDLWREMRLLYLLHGGRVMRREVDAGIVLNAGIECGARVVNLPRSSDLVLIDYEKMTEDFLFDDLDEAEVLLTRMARQYVSGLIVNGKWVLKEGTLANVDMPAVLSELFNEAKSTVGSMSVKMNEVAILKNSIRRYYEQF
jgi:cytosine/adenosine deaminase-related metal-dependent hydrolase